MGLSVLLEKKVGATQAEGTHASAPAQKRAKPLFCVSPPQGLQKNNGFTLQVDFCIENELTVLFGASGAGKSMTLNLIAGLLKPDRGRVILGDKELFNATSKRDIPPQKRSIGYVFQNHNLFPHMTVFENIMFGAQGFSKAQQREMAQEYIHTFRLEGLENNYPCEISGGQEQRAALARALVKHPSALLLDEPFSSLDQPIRIKMRRCLGEVMQKLSIPVLLVTHDVDEACALSNRVILMEKGKVVQSGRPEELLK